MRQKPQPSSDNSRHAIVRAIIAQVPFDGWTEGAFKQGAKLTSVSYGNALLLFPNGIVDVIAEFGFMADRAMHDQIQSARNFGKLRIREKVAFAVRARLDYLTPHREAVRRMMAWYALPFHWPHGMKRLYRTVDEAWRAAGDASTDFNFYTKRGLLAGVIKATILYWLDDETPGCSATWDFLERRIDDVMKAGQFMGSLRKSSKAT